MCQEPIPPLETDLLNRAAIYFDFNDPVITNTTQHRVGENFISVGAWQPVRLPHQVRVSPNPATQRALLELIGAPSGSHYQLQVFSAGGVPVWTQTSADPEFTIRCHDWQAGSYPFSIRTRDGLLLGSGTLLLKGTK